MIKDGLMIYIVDQSTFKKKDITIYYYKNEKIDVTLLFTLERSEQIVKGIKLLGL